MVRLSYDKWQPVQRDFLLGNADAYAGLPAADLATLRATLDRAHQAGLKVVIAPLSLPGMRWSQNNQANSMIDCGKTSATGPRPWLLARHGT